MQTTERCAVEPYVCWPPSERSRAGQPGVDTSRSIFCRVQNSRQKQEGPQVTKDVDVAKQAQRSHPLHLHEHLSIPIPRQIPFYIPFQMLVPPPHKQPRLRTAIKADAVQKRKLHAVDTKATPPYPPNHTPQTLPTAFIPLKRRPYPTLEPSTHPLPRPLLPSNPQRSTYIFTTPLTSSPPSLSKTPPYPTNLTTH